MIPSDPAWLFSPIVKPAGVDDPQPVLASTHEALVAQLRGLGANLDFLAGVVERSPWADGLVDEFGAIINRKIGEVAEALALFRATRNCEGQA